MDKLKQNTEVEIDISPEMVAELFCSMDCAEQAAFFNRIAEDVKTWPSCNFDLQLQYVVDTNLLTEDGKQIMRTIGSYGI